MPIADGVAVAIARGLGHAQQLGGADLVVHLCSGLTRLRPVQDGGDARADRAAILIVGRMAGGRQFSSIPLRA